MSSPERGRIGLLVGAHLCITLLALSAVVGCSAVRTPRSIAPGASPLRVGTSGDYAPFSTRATNGTLAGFDVEVARAYAAERGRAIVFLPFRWPELGSRLVAGDFDIVMSGVTVRPDRLIAGIMTATVARADAVLVVATSSPHATSIAAATARTAAHAARFYDGPAHAIAVNRGGHLEQVARTRFPHARIVTLEDNASLPAQLASGAVDAIVTDTLELGAFETRCRTAGTGGSAPATADTTDDSARCFRIAAHLSREQKAYWLPAASAALAADVDAWLLSREQSGWLPALRARLLATTDGTALTSPEASLVERIRRRLSLMPAVAAAKRARGLPIEDLGREAVVERDAVARAVAVGLDSRTFVTLLRAEIAAAKAIQRATPADGPAAYTLDDLRRAIDRLDTRFVFEFAAVAPVGATESAIADALADDDVPGLSPPLARALARALRAVHPDPGALSTGRAPRPGRMIFG